MSTRGTESGRSSGRPAAANVILKSVRDEPEDTDGYRVLIDRLWPRGVSKERAALDEWAKEVAPSDELRTAFHHGDLPWNDFVDRYRSELRDAERHEAVLALRGRARTGRVTLLYATRGGAERSQAPVLRAAILGSRRSLKG